MAGEQRAEEFEAWLKRTTALSPLTIKNYFYVVRKFLGEFGLGYSSDDLALFLTRHHRAHYNGLTVKSALVRFLRFEKRDGLIVGLPVIRVKVAREYASSLSDITLDKIRRIWEHMKPGVYRDVFAVQSRTGCRQVEAWLIDSGEVSYRDEEDKAIVPVVQKGGKKRPLYLPLKFAQAIFLKEQYEGRKYPFLPESLQRLTRDEFLTLHYASFRKAYERAIEKACVRAGLEKYGSHDARRAVGRRVWKKYGSLVAKKMLGHANIENTARYGDETTEEDVLRAVRDIDEEAE